jgi:hypothetical protein
MLYLGFNKVAATEAAEVPRHGGMQNLPPLHAAFGATLRKAPLPKGRYVNMRALAARSEVLQALPIRLSEVVMLSTWACWHGKLSRCLSSPGDDKLTNRHATR